MSDDELLQKWSELICKPLASDTNLHWESIWMGFSIGIGRPDAANYQFYMKKAFPIECGSD